MLGRPRTGTAEAALQDALALLSGLFRGAGHVSLDVPFLYLADTLMEIYGEDLRARAFIFADAGRGNELCLRPDFTGPVALAHAGEGWDQSAAYAYQGPVFRSQRAGLSRPVEYTQAGIERYGDTDIAATDAHVFALLHRGLAALGVPRPQAIMGDLSIPFALLDALEMPDRRRAALRRHFWRPARFQQLLARAQATNPEQSESRAALIRAAESADPADAIRELMAQAGEAVGVRTADEVIDRARSLAAAAGDPPMPAADAALIGDVLAVHGPAVEAAEQFRALTSAAGVDIGPAIDRFETRLEAIEAEGVPVAGLAFDATFGRSLEYYDGFVFELRAPGGGDHPPLAGGGRYDSLTVRLGAPAPVPAVGGMIRPEAVLGVRT